MTPLVTLIAFLCLFSFYCILCGKDLSAVSVVNHCVNQVNEGVREKENSDRLEWIQNHVQCDGAAEVLSLLTLN